MIVVPITRPKTGVCGQVFCRQGHLTKQQKFLCIAKVCCLDDVQHGHHVRMRREAPLSLKFDTEVCN